MENRGCFPPSGYMSFPLSHAADLDELLQIGTDPDTEVAHKHIYVDHRMYTTGTIQYNQSLLGESCNVNMMRTLLVHPTVTTRNMAERRNTQVQQTAQSEEAQNDRSTAVLSRKSFRPSPLKSQSSLEVLLRTMPSKEIIMQIFHVQEMSPFWF